MKHSVKLLFTFLLLTLCNVVFAQFQLNYQNAVPSSPEVSSIAKNVDIPVNYTSGTPGINIPFYTAKSGDIEVPISLSYNASGIRVEESPTWVGLGWNLDNGPTLNRVVRGNPDDDTYGYIHMVPNRTIKYLDVLLHDPSCADMFSFGECWDFGVNVYPTGQVDMDPDIFSFSAFGYSGKFYWNQDSGRFILSPYQNIKVECPFGYGGISAFILTLPNGIKCHFGGETDCLETMDLITTTSYNDGFELAPVNGPSPSYVTSWSIKQIIDPNGKQVEFSYTKEYGLEFGRGGETYNIHTDWMDPVEGKKASFYKQNFGKPILSQIAAENCDIYFKRHLSIREDVAIAGKSLDTIIIKNKNGIELKSFLFDYGYFLSPDSTLLWGIEQYASIARKRLYLKAVKEKNISTQDSLPPYQFAYNTTELPDRLSASQDDWGYYNGKDNIYFLIPRVPRYATIMGQTPQVIDSFPNPGEYEFYGGADRRINASLSQARMLNKITFPTGGTSNYYYEQNRVAHWQFDYRGGMEHPDLVERAHTFMPLLHAEGPYPRDYHDTFRITMPYTSVKFTPNLPSPCDPYFENSSCLYTVTLKKHGPFPNIYSFSQTHIFTLDLEAGLYDISCHIDGSTDDPVTNFTVHMDWGEAPDTNNFVIGGVRIRKIVNEDGFGNTIMRSFNYDIPNQPNISSGFLAGYPVHRTEKYYIFTDDPQFDFYGSNSPTPLTTDGQTVRYEYVTEYYDSTQTSFKTEYKFYHDFLILKFGPHDGSPLLTNEWQNNHLWEKKQYEKINDNYRILSHETYLYQPREYTTFLAGIATKYFRFYSFGSAWFLPFGQTTTTYSYPNDIQTSLITSTTNSYNSNYLLSNTEFINSKGQVIDNASWYPTDYNNVSGYNINSLLSRNILVPIKQEKSIDGKIISGNIIKYSETGLPSAVYKYENDNPANVADHDPDVVLENNYNLKTSIFYDANSNLKQLVNTNNFTSTYIWCYEINGLSSEHMNEYPAAIIQNADNNLVAYCSFETVSKGNWHFESPNVLDNTSPTGKYCYVLSGSNNILSAELGSSKIFIVSYWTKKNSAFTIPGTIKLISGISINGWQYFEHEVYGENVITISGIGSIDELRLYPKGAQMKTYTYAPSIGIVNECDANNKISYYEYDGLSRLRLIRDQDRNIIKKICYTYAGQPEACPVELKLPEWVATGNTRCQPCPENSSYMSTTREHEETDINPANTHTLRWVSEGPGTCPSSPDWQITDGNCELNSSGEYTGYQYKIENDINPCSDTYQQTRQVLVYNLEKCPVCAASCPGPEFKCVAGQCQQGVWSVVANIRSEYEGWTCVYAYCFPDGTISNYTISIRTDGRFCPITCY